MIRSRFTTEITAYKQPRVFTHETELLEREANLAFSLLEKWGMVAASPDGEDSAGRSKLRLSTPDELIDRAFAVAKAAFARARKDSLVHYVGELPEAETKD